MRYRGVHTEHLLDRIELFPVDKPRFEQIGRKLHANFMDIGIPRKIAVQPCVLKVGTRDQNQILVGYFTDGVAHDAGRPRAPHTRFSSYSLWICTGKQNSRL